MIPLALLSLGFWHNLNGINVYFTIVTFIIVISSGYDFFLKAIKYVAYILLILAIYEFITKSYLFVVFRPTEWGILPLDPKFYGGHSQIFRAKGLFEGPLALSQFAIGLAFLFRSNLKILVVAVLLTILANGRLGMVITGVMFILYFVSKYDLVSIIKSKKFIRLFFLSLVLIISAAVYLIDEKSIERISNSFSFEDNSNTARLYYWEEAINIFGDYNIFNILLGNSGYFREVTGNSAENGWLMLLLDNGILGLLFYIFPLLIVSLLSLKHKTGHWLYVGVLFLAMMVQTFNLGVSASLLYWIIIYSLFIDIKKT
ncbi:O-antigen ligase family protein [Winogradskyella sp. SM1960]|uniref:O-antigen ligase family protein n=1 Tax=Winogradskyella sp. SM1960 TaxID=2865955 RepID=UPI001CD56F1D|nr:O-antigen ligase family protein [Winogradskyella sp. SM1960]